MEHAKHIMRAVLLLVVIAVLFVLVRHFAVPESFGMYGHYRFASVADHEARELRHGAPGTCLECHDEESEAVSGGSHASVSCEVCHAPLATHVEAGEHIASMPVHRSDSLCAVCHERLAARPVEFPQVVLVDHAIEHGGPMSESTCLECHNAHNPIE